MLIPVTGVKCYPDVGENAEQIGNAAEVDYNKFVEFKCKEGTFAFTGDYKRTCQQNGNLTGHTLRCFADGKFVSVIIQF